MTKRPENGTTVFRVLDAFDHPLGGRLLRLRLTAGDAPGVRRLRGAELELVSPAGDARVKACVDAFAVFGGKPSDERLARTGRVDVHVVPREGDAGAVSAGWEARL
ncbi:MAG: hypothetical protein D6701_01015 [Gemmatimonadetes bacterium]|nr:MAG: hypothetical protein D6701_01015 [Gemmatimonadota bacterium]